MVNSQWCNTWLELYIINNKLSLNYFLGGTSRRGSYYSDDVSKKATVAMVVDSEVEPKSVFDMGKSSFNM